MEALDYRQKPICELTPHEVGRLGEDVATAFLESKGYEILDRNWRCSQGEADIVCRDKDEHVLVEVKTRTLLPQQGLEVYPEVAVDAAKLTRYANMRMAYQSLFEFPPNVRLDVIAITLEEGEERRAHVRYLRGISLQEVS